ncbi:hypothetical protein NIE88_05115 [Sporolactobacillus shoreicorticis]|uniref:Cell surface protein n=1 Tax=Sporolactobacillus shoreicorticis TaxID=1923877 RepID=A0ABW5RZG7_9BACL|nr:hypothetical protein [Sporolactobacillus shoreicorticis]MCO7125153.1 hypothetical protein [Sporolactobacillus shoreicorticis]
MKKQIIILLTVFSLTLGLLFTEFPRHEAKAASIPWGSAAWYIIKKGSNYLYNVPAQVSSGAYGKTVSPGSITLNGSKYGASAMYNVKSLSTSHSLALTAQSDIISMLYKKYSLLVINPHGNYTINTSITAGVYRGFKFGLKGTYKVQFVSNSKYKLAPYISYRYDSANSTFGTRSLDNTNLGIDVQQSDSQINGGESAYTKGYGDLVNPSWGQNVTESFDKKEITVGTLFDQFSDNGKTVFSMKNYAPNDTVNISDTIREVDYDPQNNLTNLFFSSDQSDTNYLVYKGDLRNIFSKGSKFIQKMRVVQLGDNSTFRLPDYFKYVLDNNGTAPTYK